MENQLTNGFGKQFNISEPVCKALNILGYNEPMPVQSQVIPLILEGKDLIVQSQTGSGKTGAFAIPIVERLDIDENLPQVIAITPTRELAVQVCEEMASIGKYKKIRCLPIYGKQDVTVQLKQLKQRIHAVVGTPGRLNDLMNRKKLVVDQIKFLVIDEADELLKRGFLEDLEKIISRLPRDRTTLLFSATLPVEIQEICNRYLVAPIRIEVATTAKPIDEIKQVWYEIAEDWKHLLMTKLLAQIKPKSCMIFCNTRTKADHLFQQLTDEKIDCGILHGGMPQKERLKAINGFKEGVYTYLIATDLAARGIHIDSLDLVINYNVPIDTENYVHRIGRTGRAGAEGSALTFVTVHDRKKWEEIQTYIGYKVPQSGTEMLHDGEGQQKIPNQKNKHKSPSKMIKEKLHKDITSIRINAGKQKKMRPGDIMGALGNIPGIDTADIGIIDIQDSCSYIEIFNQKGPLVEAHLTKIKGKDITLKIVKGHK